MHPVLRGYSKIALFNLFIVALIGVVLRYKIAFSLPFIDQKNLLHGHSHFAFSGWVTHALFVLLIAFLARKKGEMIFKKYRWMIVGNLLTAYGMLISFPLQGYGIYSILFSTLSIIVSYFFAVTYWKDLNSISGNKVSHLWIKAALLFNALSSLGAFSLAYMMATKNVHQHLYLASVYFFLHFQYNGWFFFALMGLVTEKFFGNAYTPVQKKIFWLFAAACIPAYFLSALWLPIPFWVYILVVIAAFSQLAGWIMAVLQAKKHFSSIKASISITAQWLIILSAVALTIKLTLQLGSTIPSLSTLAFGFRPIVIGYLHLILLAVISLCIIGMMIADKHIEYKKTGLQGIRLFTAGIIINELLLMVQGIGAIRYYPLPGINELLLAASLIMFSGITLLNLNQKKTI